MEISVKAGTRGEEVVQVDGTTPEIMDGILSILYTLEERENFTIKELVTFIKIKAFYDED